MRVYVMKKILYGICGIGNGHLYRQLPLLNYLIAKNYQIMVFAYGVSYDYLIKNVINDNVKVVEVCVPYYIDSLNHEEGLDFIHTEQLNKSFDMQVNLKAFAQAQAWLGKPDAVISDYEPNSVQYGYACAAKVITLDQQSKYFIPSLPETINDTCLLAEKMRLNMFFPMVHTRFACSFFNIENCDNDHNVQLIPPMIRTEIMQLKNNTLETQDEQYVVYLSAQQLLKQSVEEFLSVLSDRVNILNTDKKMEKYHIFVCEKQYEFMQQIVLAHNYPNIAVYKHGNIEFEMLLQVCNGLITTAGHTLLSEAMYLKIPVYAITLPLYEQQLSGYMIEKNHFGVCSNDLNKKSLDYFVKNIALFRDNIITDKYVLLTNKDNSSLLEMIEKIIIA